MSTKTNKKMRQLRHVRLRKKISGTPEKPRMCVCCTGKHIYVQFIDDTRGQTLAAVSTLDPQARAAKLKANLGGAAELGKLAAERAKAVQVSQVVFDRGGFKYHGRVKAIADSAREAGLKF
ncbi:MAG: 50S ribosomal protein L18 [Lentisphaeria bacterium]|jgi:large subunit ribosomal protein L18